MKKCKKHSFAVIAVGLLFFVAGIMKLFVMGPSEFATGLQGMLGFGPGLALVAAWIVAIIEFVGGAALLLGCKFPCVKTYKNLVRLLIVIIVVATVVTNLGRFDIMSALQHLVILGVLVDICSRMKKCHGEKKACGACAEGTCTHKTNKEE